MIDNYYIFALSKFAEANGMSVQIIMPSMDLFHVHISARVMTKADDFGEVWSFDVFGVGLSLNEAAKDLVSKLTGKMVWPNKGDKTPFPVFLCP